MFAFCITVNNIDPQRKRTKECHTSRFKYEVVSNYASQSFLTQHLLVTMQLARKRNEGHTATHRANRLPDWFCVIQKDELDSAREELNLRRTNTQPHPTTT